MAEEVENKQETDAPKFWDIVKGKFARLFTSYAAAPIRCRVIAQIEDPTGRPMLLIMLPGQIKHLVYLECVYAYEVFDSLEQLKKIVQADEVEEFDSMSPRQGRRNMLYGPGEIEQP